MATSKQIEQPPPYTVIALAVTAVLCGAGLYFQWPVAPLAFIGVLVAASLSRSPVLTGPKDPQTQYPTVGNAGEQKALNRHRFWRTVPGKLFACGPLWPITTNMVIAIGAGMVSFALPYEGSWRLFELIDAVGAMAFLPWLNGMLVVLLIAGFGAALRSRDPENGLMPPTEIVPFIKDANPGQNPKRFMALVSAVSAALLLGLGANWWIITADWYLISPAPVAGAGLALIAFGVIAHASTVRETRRPWLEMCEARSTWAARWPSMPKLKEFPQLTQHKRLGENQEVWVDEFQAPAMQGAKFWTDKPVPDGIEPLMPANTMVAFLSVPDIAGDGSPITLSRSATRFRVITWNGDHPLDVTDPSVDRELLSLWLDLKVSASCAAAWGSMFSLIPLNEPDPLHVELDEWTGAETGAWRVEYGVTQGVNLEASMAECVSSARLALGPEVEVLPIGTSMYIGAITYETTELKDDTILAELEAEQESQAWERRWKDITGPGMQAPTYFPEHDASEHLDSRTVIEYRLFGAPAGLSVKDYFMKATPDRIQSGLKGASWSTATFYVDPHSKKRYPHLMQIMWSEQQIPLNPARITPSDSHRAAQWAITGAINAAFLGAKLPRPEVMSVKPLTSRQSRGHIWEVTIELLDGMTLADVRKNQSKLKSALEGCEWLRVGSHTRGCRIMFGAMPSSRRTWANPDAETAARKLDWEQFFIDSKIKNMREETPELLDVKPLPKNDLVREFRFKMPAGLAISDVRKETGKLMSTTGNGFLDIRQGTTPAEMIIQAAEESPMPSLALFDWDEVRESKAVPFATNIQGEPMAWDPLVDPHVVLLGASGSGKAQPLDTRIPVPISKKFPNGWALLAELEVGDRVLTPTGGTSRIRGFSDEKREPVYVFELSDGQEVRSSGHHVWAVRSRRDRTKDSKRQRGVKLRSELLAKAKFLRQKAAEIEPGLGGTSQQIAEIAGIGLGPLHNTGVLHEVISRQILERSSMRARVYDTSAYLRGVRNAIRTKGVYRLYGNEWTAEQVDELDLDGSWLSLRNIAEVMSRGGETTREMRHAISLTLRRSGADSRDGFERVMKPAYPVDEVLVLLAEVYEARARGHEYDPYQLMHSEDIASTVRCADGEVNWSIDLPKSVLNLADSELPMSPYALGAWLGDGSASGAAVTSMDMEIIDHIGYPVRRVETKAGGENKAQTYHFDDMLSDLYATGLERIEVYGSECGSTKFAKRIPPRYLRASQNQRLELLRGLMDTDGSISKSGSCELTLCDEPLANDALELIRSLGIKAAMSVNDARYTLDGQRTDTGVRYRIKFTTDLPVFHLSRKKDRLPDSVRSTQSRVYITNVRIEEDIVQKCLRLDSAEHLYLTDGFVRTHNSAAIQSFLTPAAIQGYELHIFDKPKGAADFQYLVPYAKQVATEYVTIATALENVYKEVERRKELNQQYGASRVRNLPDEVRPPHMLVVIDEFTSTIKPELLDKITGDETEDQLREREFAVRTNQYKGRIGAAVGKIMREARSAGVSMMVAGQTLSADEMKASPALGNIKNQAAVILLGKASFGQRASAFKNVELAPELGESVPKGRGIFESSEGAPAMFQAWYGANFADFETGPEAEAAHLSNMVEQISSVRSPELTQLFDDDLRPDEAEIRAFGEIIAPGNEPDAAQEEVIDMGELDLDLSFDDLDFDLGEADQDPTAGIASQEPTDSVSGLPEEASMSLFHTEPPGHAFAGWSEADAQTVEQGAPTSEEPAAQASEEFAAELQGDFSFDIDSAQRLTGETVSAVDSTPQPSVEQGASEQDDDGIFARRTFSQPALRPSMADDLFG